MIEFTTGDRVHFQPYKERKPIEAKVMEVIQEPERVRYRLDGISSPLISVTCPESIVESERFYPIAEADWLLTTEEIKRRDGDEIHR